MVKKMKNKNRVGSVSLIVAITGFIITVTVIGLGLVKGQGWYIVLAGFEAGTIGGLADWFAVSALFHEIPIPVVRRHTNIIVNNRKQLTEGVVDLITNKWLTPDVIKEKISEVYISENILKVMQEPKNKSRAIDFVRDVLNGLSDSFDKPEVAGLLQKILKDQIEGIDIATPLGHWLEKSVKSGEYNQLWEMILDTAQRKLNEEQTRQLLLNAVKAKAEEYKKEGFLKKTFLGIAEKMGALDELSIANKIIESINDFIDEAKNNPNHNIRRQFDRSILEFAHNLIIGDEKTHNTINDLKQKLIENTDAKEIIQGVLIRFKSTVKDELKSNDTSFMILLTKYLNNYLDELQEDKSAQQKIDVWMKETILQLVSKYHYEIGNMVRQSLSKLDDTELVAQIEEQVGNDLQYIRLNGAVVGSIVGVILAVVKLVVL
jgi:uncharacterized membrane-anchored protein YjiN (DUF445 family)